MNEEKTVLQQTVEFAAALTVEHQSPHVRRGFGVVAVEMRQLVFPMTARQVVDGIGGFAVAKEGGEETDHGESVVLLAVVGGHHLHAHHLWGVSLQEMAEYDVVRIDVVGASNARIVNAHA